MDQPIVQLEKRINALRDEPRLLFTHNSESSVSGSLKSLDRVPLWIPAETDALTVWSRATGNAEVVLLIHDAHGIVAIQEVLRHGVPNTMVVSHKPNVLGTWSTFSLGGQSGVLQQVSIYAR